GRERQRNTGNPDADRLGLRVEEVDDRHRQRWSLEGGVLVRQVEPNSAAAQTGLRPGDVIVQLGYEDIANRRDYDSQVEKLPEDKLLPIRFYRQGQPMIRTIRIESD